MKKSLLLTVFVLIALWLSTDFVHAEMRSSISQYGITWTFNGQYECGQFVTGDWWVVGPVTINSVSPAPSPGRNGSCVNPMPNRQGYDDRSYPGDLYSAADRISYPVTLNADQTLVSSVSRSSVTKNYGSMQSQAVLTVVSSPQPSGTFRPAYCGTYKRYFNTSQVNMSILPNLPPPSSVMNASNLANYTDPPRIDHLGTWQIQFGCAEDNWNNGVLWGNEKHKCYGQQYSELISEAALHTMLSVPEKTQLVNNLIQFGIDNYGVLRAGGKFAADGGHYSGRKFPIVFAAVLLNDADMLQVGVDYTSRKFGEYDQTYYNSSGKALWGRRVSDYCWWYAGCTDSDPNCHGSKDVADPDQLTDGCPTYRGGQTSRNWVGQALATLMIGGKSVWAHDAYFDYMDRWMDGDVGGGGSGHNDFVTDMWNLYRDNLPSGGGSVSVTGVSVSPSTITLDEGMSQQLTETVSPTDATNKIVTWSSDNMAVATVNSSGLVTGISSGNATITATTLDGSFTDNCAVTINSLGTNVALNKSITVSSYDVASDKPGDNLVDGDVSDDARWSASGFPQWAEIDLGANYDLNRIDVFPYQDRPYQYIIEGKSDGGSYSTIVDRSANTVSADNLYNNVSATVRYLKITVNGISGNTSTWVSLSELKAFANSEPPPTGNEFYCSPSGSMSNNGTSPSTPWADLATVVSQKTFADGSTIYLMDGNHGSPVITESNTANVTITKYAGANPVINNIDINGADYWIIKDIKISANGAAFPNQNVPLTHPVYPLEENALVYILNSDNILIENCDISSIDNSSVWTTADDWNYTAWNGVMVSGGADVTIKDNHIKNVNFGNTAGGTANYIFRNNTVENFCGDGMQLGSNYAKVEYNTFKNCYKTNGNHDDILQFYKGSGSSYGVEIRGNKLLDYTDPAQPFRGEAQGIGIFDGYQHNFIIENNLIVTDSWHGITVYGAINCTINNNSVIEINNTGIGPCWIQITAAKDGTPATGNIVRNNLTTRLNNDSGIGTVENNDVISWSEYDAYFVDFANFDLHLTAGSPAIDTGTSSGAPSTDLDGVTRPQGSGYDIGCYEYVGGSVIPVTGVSVSPTSLALDAGQSSDLTETVAPANATDQSVTWSSNNTSVATVDANGLVSAVSAGSAIITATTVDGSYMATCDVTVTEITQSAYVAQSLPGRIQIEDYDYGGQDVAYNELDGDKRLDASIRPEDQVDLTTTSDVDGNVSIGWTADGEWLEYTLANVATGTYDISVRAATTFDTPGNLVLSLGDGPDGTNLTQIASITIDNTGGWTSWQTFTVTGVSITGGSNKVLRATISGIAFDLNWIDFAINTTVPVTGVTLSSTNITLDEGQTSDLDETVAPANAMDKSVSWSTSNGSIATVDANGLVTAVSAGNATITVTTTDGGFTATCDVTVTVPVDGVTVSPTSLSLNIGATSDLTATISPADASDQSVTWSSGDISVATVDANGLVTAVSVGSTVITVTTTDGSYTATCNVEVNAIINNLAFNKPITVSAYQDDSYGYKPGVNLVDGDVTDDARWSASGFPQWAEIDLGADYDLTRIDLYPYQNRAYQYIVEAKTSVGSYMTIVDRSSNTVGADVLSNNVNATARYIKITVSGLSGSASTWVSLSELEVYGTLSSTVFVTGVSLSSSTLGLDEGQTSSLTATVSPANASDQTVTWSSSNSSVATVNASGLITGIDAGSCTITTTTNDGSFTADCNVMVIARVNGVTVSPPTLDLEEGQTSDLTETVSPIDAADQSVAWSSSNNAIATVDANGLVTAVSAGSCTITVTTNDGSYTANCSVTVTAVQQTVILNPVADAAVRGGGYENDNYGSSTNLTVKNDIISYTRETYIKFDLSTISLPVSSAILRLYVSDDGVSTHTAKLVSDDSWTESGITYANKPSAGSTITSWDVTATGNYYIEADITSVVMSEAGDMLTIQITASNNDYINYSSKETTNKPELVVISGSSTIPVSGVSVAPTLLSLDEGQSLDLTETVSPVDATDQTVTWSSNNTSVATIDANGLVTAVSAGSCTITVTTNDGSYTANCSVTVTAIPQSRTETVIASNDDQEIRSNGGAQWVGYDIHRVGGAGAGYDGASVHPFQLPALNAGEIILDASFTINLKLKANTPSGNVDVYGLPYRSTSGVSSSGDYWQGAYGADPNATPIQDNFVVSSTPYGGLVTSSTGNSNLIDYINAQYAAGAQGGDYIFIRLNPDVADVDNYEYWEFYSADASNKPVLDLEIGDDPYSSGEVEEESLISNNMSYSVNVWPNPVNETESLKISLNGYNANETLVMKIVDITGKMTYGISNLRMDENGSRTLEVSTNLMRKGIYILHIYNGSGLYTSKISIQ